MKTYSVIALSVGGSGNKIYHSGDTVKENNFPAGRADELVKQGFLKLKSEDKTEAVFASEAEVEVSKVEKVDDEEVIMFDDLTITEEDKSEDKTEAVFTSEEEVTKVEPEKTSDSGKGSKKNKHGKNK